MAEFARRWGSARSFTPDDLKDPLLYDELAACKADLFVVVAFRILPKTLFSLPRLGTINIHASLLPKYRGPAPIQRAIEAGETETGVTVFRIDEGIDTGKILLQKRISIGLRRVRSSSTNGWAARGRIAHGNARSPRCWHVMPKKQDHGAASGAPKLTKEEAAIDWHCPSQVIFNKIRAFKPFPGLFAIFEGERLGIEAAEVLPGSAVAAVGRRRRGPSLPWARAISTFNACRGACEFLK